MKKTFVLSHPKIKLPRLVDSIRHEVKKYLRRERNKQVPDGADFWDFDCRFGTDRICDGCLDKTLIKRCYLSL